MAVELADAYISLVPSAKGIGKSISAELGDVDGIGRDAGDRTSKGFMSSFGSGVAGIGKVVGLAAIGGGIAVGAFAAQSVQAASSFNEAFSKVGVVFQEGAGDIQEWSKTTTDAFGISRKEALAAAGDFGNLFRSMGIATPTAVEMSKSMVELAGDLSSFNDVPTEDALLAIRSALVGETEPIRAMGVNMNDARLKAEALSLGLVQSSVDVGKLSTAQETAEKAGRKAAEAMKKFGEGSVEFADASRDAEQANAKLAEVMQGKVPESLTAAQKAQAAYSLIMKDTTLAQGDAARTHDSFANTQRRLGKQLDDLKVKIGTGLLPVMSTIAGFVGDKVLPAFTGLGDKIGPLISTIGLLAGSLASAFSGEGVTSDGLFGLFERIGVIARQVFDFVVLGFDSIRSAFSGEGVTSDGVTGVFERIGVIARQVFDIIAGIDFGAVFSTVVEFVKPIAAAVVDLAGNAFTLLAAIVTTLIQLFKDNRDTIQSVGEKLLAVGGFIRNVVLTAADALGGTFRFLATHMELVKAIAIPLIAAFATYKAIMLGVQIVTNAVALATKIWTGIQAAFNIVMSLNPIGIVIAAIAALVAGVVYAYTHFETFRNIVDTAWQILQIGFNWVRDNWPLLLAILTGPIGVGVLLIIKHWDTIKDAFSAVKDWIGEKIGEIVGFFTELPGRILGKIDELWERFKAGFGLVKDWIWQKVEDIVGFYVGMPGRILGKIDELWERMKLGAQVIRDWIWEKVENIVGFFTGLPGRIGNVVGGMFDGISGAFRSAINFIIRGWNSIEFRIPGFSVGPVSFGGFVLGLPDIPQLAAGGVVTRATLALLGESGPEAVIPLDRFAGEPSRGGGVRDITINTLGKPDAHELAREVAWQMKTAGV